MITLTKKALITVAILLLTMVATNFFINFLVFIFNNLQY